MRIAAVSRVDMVVDTDRRSAEFHMSTSKLQAGLMVGLSLAGIAGLLLPVALIAGDAMTNPQVINTLVDHLGSTALLAAGIGIGLVLLMFPLRAGLIRLGGESVVRMAEGQVTMERHGLLGTSQWSAPLAQFCGVTHHIRATLSGPRHEIILIHPEPAKDVLLHMSSRHPSEGADYYARLLGLPEMPPRELYNSRRRAPEVAASAQQSVELRAQAA